MKRHDLVILNSIGREYAVDEAVGNHPELSESFIHQIIAGDRIPGIIKRQEESETDQIQIGFSTWHYRPDGGRIRLNSAALKEQIAALVSPFEVLLMVSDIEPYVSIRGIAGSCKVEAGLYGSSALQAVTGKKYRNEKSDIDIYLGCPEAGGGDLINFQKAVSALERDHQISFDIEVEYRNRYGIKLKELLSAQKTVLAKGLYDVQLFERQTVLEELMGRQI